MKLDQLKDLQNLLQCFDKYTSKERYDHYKLDRGKLAKFINIKVKNRNETDHIIDLLQRGNIINIVNKPYNQMELSTNNVKIKEALILINEDVSNILLNQDNNNKEITDDVFKHLFNYDVMDQLVARDPTLRVAYDLLILAKKNDGNMIFCNYKPSDYWDLWISLNNVIRTTFHYPLDPQFFGVDSDDIAKAMKKFKKMGIISQVAGIITLNRYRLYVHLVNVKNILMLNKQ